MSSGLHGTRMISFTWAMPPYMEDIRPHMTIVQLWFMPLPNGKTRLRLFHTGFGDTPAWQKGRDYFAKTWPDVIARYDAHINDESLNHFATLAARACPKASTSFLKPASADSVVISSLYAHD